MAIDRPILVTGAAGRVGGVGGAVVEVLRQRDVPVRALVRRDPDHVFEHLLTMARLHAANRYDRLTHDVEAITGRPATSALDFVAHHAAFFGPNSRSAQAPAAS